MVSDRPTDEELQEKASYDIIQYLPLDSIDIYNNSITNIVNNTVKKEQYLG